MEKDGALVVLHLYLRELLLHRVPPRGAVGDEEQHGPRRRALSHERRRDHGSEHLETSGAAAHGC